MKQLIVFLLFLFFISSNASSNCSNKIDCPKLTPPSIEPQCTWLTHNQEQIDQIIKEKQATSTHQTNLVQFIADKFIKSKLLVESNHLIQIFDNFLFEEKEMFETIKAVAIRFHPMTSCEIITLINLFKDEEKKFAVFKLIYSSLRIQNAESNNKIIAQLPDCNKTEAYELLSSMNQFNCLFGRLKGNVIAFVIDANNQMTGIMSKDPEYSYIDYVKQQLKDTILTQIKPGMKFNIIVSYSDYKDVTERSLNSAFKFIDDIRIQGHQDKNVLNTGIKPSLVTQFQVDTIAAVWHQWSCHPYYSHHPHCHDFYSWFYKQTYPYQLNYYIFE